MRARCRHASFGALLLPILLTGCSLFPTTRKLPVPKAPLITQTVKPDELVAQLNQRWDALKTRGDHLCKFRISIPELASPNDPDYAAPKAP